MNHKIRRTLTKYSFVLFTLFALAACDSGPSPKVGAISAKSIPQVDDFIQSQISENWSKLAAAGKPIPLQMFVRVGLTSDPSICTTGELYGPYMLVNDSVEGEQSAMASQPTLRLSNLGDMSVCMIITSPVNADLDIEADTLFWGTNECNETPSPIAGVWEGNYSCTSSCGDEIGFVSLTIDQDENSATYFDGSANYEGTVCGNEFRFSGGGPGYTESGTFVLNSDGMASKTSSYQNTGDSCTGTCSDPNLVLQ